MEEKNKIEVVEIELSKLIKSPYNVRVEASVIGELAKNIQKNGLDNAIVVRPAGKEKYEIVQGSRRVKAYETLGRKKIPAIIRDLPDHEAMRSSLQENILRTDISPEEKARAVAILLGRKELLNEKDIKLIPDKTFTEQTLADTLGITRQSINNMLEPLRQAKETRQLVRDGMIGEDTARQIRQFVGDNTKNEIKVAKAFANAELKQTEARDLLQKARTKKQTAEDLIKEVKGEDKIKDDEIKDKLSEAIDNATKSDSKPSLTDGISRDDIDLDETLSISIKDKKIIKALNKCAEDEGITADEVAETAVKEYLKKQGYIKK